MLDGWEVRLSFAKWQEGDYEKRRWERRDRQIFWSSKTSVLFWDASQGSGRASSVGQWWNLPAMQETEETQVWSLVQEDPLEKEMATHWQYSCLGNPMDREDWWANSPWDHKESDTSECIWSSSVQFSHTVVSDSWRPHESQHASPPCPSPAPGASSNSCPLSDGDAIWPSHPLSSPSPLAFNLSQHQGLFQWVNSSHQVAKVLEFQL